MTLPFVNNDLSNREFFIHRWEQEYPGFVRVIQSVPPDQLEYRPHPKSRSAGQLVAFLVSQEKACVELCVKGASSYNASIRWHPDDGAVSLEEMLIAYELHHRELGAKLNAIDDRIWRQSAWMILGEQEILLRDTVGGLLWLALFDAVHHRGQLSAYIRPMGGKVPSIYGPSADSPPA
ncbi:MAG TPA: DinB family protein [Terriglobia bacterium]|nr:DinB family protein [Terriglobia bacterium]